MATKPRQTLAHHVFGQCVRHFHRTCGSPNFKDLTATVSRVPNLYPEYARTEKPKGLSRANIFKIINGDHGGLPTSAQFAYVILALQHLGAQWGDLSEDPGVSSLSAWQSLLREARHFDKEQREGGPFASDAEPFNDSQLRVSHVERLPPELVPSGETSFAPMPLTNNELHYLADRGPHALLLALRSSTGDPDTLFELAIILGCADAPYNERAADFASNAGTWVSAAADLLRPDNTLRRDRAVFAARMLAHKSQGEAAALFRSCAARADNPSPQFPPMHG